MDISVIIPTCGRADKLRNCLATLGRQELAGDRFEVIVGFDGPDAAGERSAHAAWGDSGGKAPLRTVACPREGYTLVRNRMLALARGRILVSLNDDVRPVAAFLNVHLAEHDLRAAGKHSPAIVVGHSPYSRRDHETLLDRLVRSTSMVFFYDTMSAAVAAPGHDPDRDWGFRHCFGLNFSAPLACVREVGGFFARPHLYGYDDIELGSRIAQRFKAPVLYRPAALAEHEHFYRPQDLLDREHQLGLAAWHFARGNPAFGLACFGRDICSDENLAYSRAFVERERDAANRLRDSFSSLGNLPGSCIDGPHAQALLTLIAGQHLLLKRWTWRNALLEAAA